MRGLIWRRFAWRNDHGQARRGDPRVIGNMGANYTTTAVGWWRLGTVGPDWNYTSLEQAIQETAAAYLSQLGN